MVNYLATALIYFEYVCTDRVYLNICATNANTDGSTRTSIGNLLERIQPAGQSRSITCMINGMTSKIASNRILDGWGFSKEVETYDILREER